MYVRMYVCIYDTFTSIYDNLAARVCDYKIMFVHICIPWLCHLWLVGLVQAYVGECMQAVGHCLLDSPHVCYIPDASFSPRLSESCLGPGFTETVPPAEELSQYSATVLQPGDRAIYTTLSFRCNGTLESLTIPSQVRGSDYRLVDDYIGPRPSIWRFNGGYRFLFESGQEQRTTTEGGVRLSQGNVLPFNFTVGLQMDIQAGDTLGFQLNELGGDGRIEHLPLLYKPGPTPGTFTPIIIANFNPTSDPPTSEPSVEPSPIVPSDGELGSLTK